MSAQLASWKKQLIFWLLLLAATILTIASLREILLPFIKGLGLAYFLDPVVDILEEYGLSRLWATIVITVIFGVGFVTGLIVLIPILINEAANLAAAMPEHIQNLKAFVLKWRAEYFGELSPTDRARFDGFAQDVAKEIASWSAIGATSLLSGGFALFNFVSLLLITPVVTFYLLKDWDRIVERVNNSLPRDHAPTVRRLAREVNEVMAGFVRGQVTVLILLGIFYVIGLTLVGLNFGVLIGIVAGLISFIPFVGSMVGFILAGAVAFAQFWPDWAQIAIVFAIFLSGQLIEGNLLSPKIVGDSVKLHPVWLIFSLFVFGYMLGFVGLIIAVPVAAAIGVLVRFALEKYHESEFFRGQGEAG